MAQKTETPIERLLRAFKMLKPESQLTYAQYFENRLQLETLKPKKKKEPRFEFPPFSLSADEIQMLWENDNKSGAFSELDRVANNIWNTLNNPNTPEIVKEHIKQYVRDLINFDFMDYRAAIQMLFILACMNISEIPFVPNKKYIETLTGNNMEKAIEETKKDFNKDFYLFQSIEINEVQKLADELILSTNQEDNPLNLARLIHSIGNEPNPTYRKNLVDIVIFECFNEEMRYSDEYFTFLDVITKHPFNAD